MLYEIIRTRCGSGYINLFSSDFISGPGNGGHKVYSMSKELLNDNSLLDTAFADSFIGINTGDSEYDSSDVHMFIVPDFGLPFMMNSHAIPFDPDNISPDIPIDGRRSGNFINQAFVGNFDKVYPFELFNNDNVWDAKQKGEAYYYNTETVSLPSREEFVSQLNLQKYNEIKSFILNGREMLLKSAVSFLIEQYSLPPEKRKFIVIYDETTKDIEMWISSIEVAFSPKIASHISFVTRFKKDIRENTIFVNPENGKCQFPGDFSNTKPYAKAAAMLYGISRKSNSNLPWINQNSNFVILNGIDKSFSENVDINNAYFSFITSYSQKQFEFCSDFLQMLNYTSLSKDIFNLYSSYKCITNVECDIVSYLNSLKVILKYEPCKCDLLRHIYIGIKEKADSYLKKDIKIFLDILPILNKFAGILDLRSDINFGTEEICSIVAENIYRGDSNRMSSIMSSLKKTNLLEYASADIVENISGDVVSAMSSDDLMTFSEIFFECVKNAESKIDKSKCNIILPGLFNLFSEKNDLMLLENKFAEMNDIIADLNVDFNSFWINVISRCEEKNKGLLLKAFIYCNNIVFEDFVSLSAFFEILKDSGMSGSLLLVADIYLDNAPASLIEDFLKNITHSDYIKEVDITGFLRLIDNKLNIASEDYLKSAEFIQKARRKNSLINSAHILAIKIIKNAENEDLKSELVPLFDQGFLNVISDKYAKLLTSSIADANLSTKNFEYLILTIFENSPVYLSMIVSSLLLLGKKQTFVRMINFLGNEKNSAYQEQFINILVSAFNSSGKSKSEMENIRFSFTDNFVSDFYLTALSKSDISNEKNKSAKKHMSETENEELSKKKKFRWPFSKK